MLKKITPQEIALDLADEIESDKINLDMLTWTYTCGAPACIAGHIVYRYGDFKGAVKLILDSRIGLCGSGTFAAQAADILGLGDSDRQEMFLTHAHHSHTKEDVVEMLRHWTETGEVDWERCDLDRLP